MNKSVLSTLQFLSLFVITLQAEDYCHKSSFENPEISLDTVWKEAIKTQDKIREDFLMLPINQDRLLVPSHFEIKNRFYHTVSSPLQSYCQVSKLIGGEWLGNCGAWDGAKYICMDKFAEDVKRKKCLVYSFGIADDWSFEDVLSQMGCTVHAFDPTIDAPSQRSENIYFYKLGLSRKSGKTQVTINNKNNKKVVVPVKSLADILKSFNHTAETISYIKVDIEGSELDSFPEWADSDLLQNVGQLGIEFHLGLATIKSDERLIPILLKLQEAFQKLYNRGFRLVYYQPNGCVGKSQDSEKRFYAYFDLFFLNIHAQ